MNKLTREQVIMAISLELAHHHAFIDEPVAQLVWATRIYDKIVLLSMPAEMIPLGGIWQFIPYEKSLPLEPGDLTE